MAWSGLQKIYHIIPLNGATTALHIESPPPLQIVASTLSVDFKS